jgi:hypothetical protein
MKKSILIYFKVPLRYFSAGELEIQKKKNSVIIGGLRTKTRIRDFPNEK